MSQLILRTLGILSLEGKTSSRLSPQILLLLSYLKLEGVPARLQLANLFWPDAAHELTKKGERKDLRNLGSALATLRRELGFDPEDQEALSKLSCDAVALEENFKNTHYEQAFETFLQGKFLENIEHKPRLNLSSELSEWLTEKRQLYKRQANEALLKLAEQAMQTNDVTKVKYYAQQAYEQNQDQLEPAFLSRLYQLLLFAGSPLATQVRQTFESCLEDALEEGRLSEESITLFLILSLQDPANLATAQVAANLSPKASTLCLEELIRENLVGAKQEVLAPDIASYYLAQRPSERLKLLANLRDNTADKDALGIYRTIHKYSQSYGGAGYWIKAQNAYKLNAQRLIAHEDFRKATILLDELKQAEDNAQKEPQAAIRFLHAYALERLRQPEQGLLVIANIDESLEVKAIKSALLLRSKNYKEAKRVALDVYKSASASDNQSWARAIATGSLGQIAYFEQNLEESSYFYDLSIAAWQLCRVKSRELGTLMNRAIILSQSGEEEKAIHFYQTLIHKSDDYPLLKIRSMTNLAYLFMQQENWQEAVTSLKDATDTIKNQQLDKSDPLLSIEVMNNLGYSLWKSGNLAEAHVQLNHCMDLSTASGEKLMYAAALGNLGAIHNDLGKLETALNIFNELGNQREYKEYDYLYQESLNHFLEHYQGNNKAFVEMLQSNLKPQRKAHPLSE